MWDELLRTRSIFSLFPEQAIAKLDFKLYVQHVQADQLVEPENLVSDHLTLTLDTPLLLYRSEGNEKVYVGAVEKGRSCNLYSFLRNQVSQNSVHIQGPASYLRVPRVVIESLFELFPDVKTYLLMVTEKSTYRTIASELRNLDIEPGFIIKFITNLKAITATHNEKVVEKGQPWLGPIFLSEGVFLLRHTSKQQSPRDLPLRVWLGWREAANSESANVTITAIRSSEYLLIPFQKLSELRSEFSNDYGILEKWIVRGQLSQAFYDEGDAIEMDDEAMDNLFSGAIDEPDHQPTLSFVSQSGEMDCGPACLAMISRYFGKDLSIQFWRAKLSTGRSGTSLYDLGEVANKFGFVTHRLAFSHFQDLGENMFPFICLKNSHYFVVYKAKVNKNSVVVGDPARGLITLMLSDFEDGQEHVGLFLKPNLQFTRLKASPSQWKHYFHFLYAVRRDLIFAFTFGFFGVCLSVVVPLLTQMIIDDVVVKQDSSRLFALLGIASALTALLVIFNWTRYYFFHSVAARFNFIGTSAFIQKMFSLPFYFFSTRHVGDFTNRVTELSKLRSFLTGTLFEVSMNVCMLIFYSVVLLVTAPKIALVTFALAILMLVVPMYFSNRMALMSNQIFELRSSQFGRITDLVTGIATIKSTRSETAIKTRFNRELHDVVNNENRFSMMSTHLFTLSGAIYQFANLTVIGVSANMGISGALSPGQVIFLIMISSKIFGPVRELAEHWERFIQTKSAMNRLNDIFLSPSEGKSRPLTQNTMPPLKGEIEFRDVWFRYGGENSNWVLREISFKIKPGERVAIVGASGSGKSTIACLLSRLYEPTKGQIFIDGRDYREYDLDFLRAQIGLLHQEPALFSGSILTNIGLNTLDPDLHRATEAAERASATNLIQERQNGFEHFISHGGHGFSKGEKQRLALARLFYSNPQLLILDEATASLDGMSEKKIMSVIATEMRDQTVINIAHRYSTLLYSQSAIVLSHGRVVGFGSIEYLKESSAVFQELFNFNQDKIFDTLKMPA